MPSNKVNKKELEEVSEEQILSCISILKSLNENTGRIFAIPEADRIALMKEAGLFSRPSREEFLKRRKEGKKAAKRKLAERDRHARKSTGIRSAREADVFSAPKMICLEETTEKTKKEKLLSPRNCYVCKELFSELHHFYDSMCENCGDFNYAKRFQTADLTGQVALVTGSRLKIGYHITLMLLRAGAQVIATTRFPVDSANRYAKEKDYNAWSNRLHIHGLDLRHIPSVELFCNFINQRYSRLDILINNAAQTVRRPASFYSHLIKNEEMSFNEIPATSRALLRDHQKCVNELGRINEAQIKTNNQNMPNKNLPVSWQAKQFGIGITSAPKLSQIPYSIDGSLKNEELFPEGKLDADLQQVDLRKVNSWRLKLGEINTTEMLEVQLVNSVAPFVLCNYLSELMKKENTGKKHIINVSAMEGKFHRWRKETRHPHTNMAKAALNMMTHTAAGDLVKHGIYINAVDTGWVTDEDPIELARRKEQVHDFQPPLDIVDGAARVLDPLFDGINKGTHWCGKFLKDYAPIDW